MKKLVIGLKSIKGADKCVEWLEPVPVIGNYHQVYIYLPSLTSSVLEKVLKVNSKFFTEYRSEMFDAIKAGTVEIFCVSDSREEYNTNSNYSIFPFGIKRIDKEITTFNEEANTGYLSLVEKTNGYFEWGIDDTYLNTQLTSTDKIRFSWKQTSLLDSLHQKMVALEVKLMAERWVINRYHSDWDEIKNFGGRVIFVPKTTKIDSIKGFEDYLNRDSISENKVEKPDWFSEITFPPENELEEQRSIALKNKEEAEKTITETDIKLGEIEDFKWALRLKGIPLENAVDKIFEFLGVPLVKGRKNQEDRWLEIGENRVPIEIKGHEQFVHRSDLRQIIDRTQEAENKVGKTVGILIANPYCETPPNKRPVSFDDKNDKIISGAMGWDIALIDTLTLLSLVDEKMKGRSDIENILSDKLLSTIGVVKFNLNK